MEVYTVKQVADMLKINPETIRRWIRLNKLKAIKDSRKEGNVITQDALSEFLKSMPKYAGIAAGAAGLARLTTGAASTGLASLGLGSPTLGLPLLAESIVGALVRSTNKNNDDSLILSDDLEKYLKTKIELHEDNIRIKEKNIEQIKLEIESERKQINEIKELIKRKKEHKG